MIRPKIVALIRHYNTKESPPLSGQDYLRAISATREELVEAIPGQPDEVYDRIMKRGAEGLADVFENLPRQ